MQTLVINRQNGNIAKALAGQDHISGLLFVVASAQDVPEAFASERFRPCSSTKTADELDLTSTSAHGRQVREALRLNPGLTLWVGYAERSDGWAAVARMQQAAGGNIRQLGILDTEAPISAATVSARLTRLLAPTLPPTSTVTSRNTPSRTSSPGVRLYSYT